jgi:hypothetical protein
LKWVYSIVVASEALLCRWGITDSRINGEEADATTTSIIFSSVADLLRSNQFDPWDAIAYCSSFMDGWSKTHEELCDWLDHVNGKGCQAVWQQFVKTDMLRIDSRVTLYELKQWLDYVWSQHELHEDRLNDYAVNSMCHSIATACTFALSTGCTLVVVAKVVGVSRDDREYLDR